MKNTGTTKTGAGNYNGLTVGDTVECNGHCMTVTRLVEWSTALVECRTHSGEVCVDSSEVRKLTSSEARTYSVGDKIS